MRSQTSPRWRLFLDANILISAAWKDGSKVARIWSIPGIELVTSNHVLNECRRNLPREEHRLRLAKLLLDVRILEFSTIPVLENPPLLHEKDQHVLAAAVLSRADFLVTGDRAHFGQWFGTSVTGIRVEPPARFPFVLEQHGENFK
jgi:predicted nucleic acid-binding protein